MEHGEIVLSYINRVKRLAGTLESMDVQVEDKETAMAVLNRLSSSCDCFIVVLDALGNKRKVFSFDLVRSRRLQEEQRVEMREKSIENGSGLSALLEACRHAANMNIGTEAFRISSYECTHYGRDGHTQDCCWGRDINGKRPTALSGNRYEQSK